MKIWRRSYDITPPPLKEDDPRHPKQDPRYASLDPSDLPATESLKTTLDRVVPYWEQAIAPELRAGRDVLIAAHGNSLRARVKRREDISEQDIVELNIPTGSPRAYELDSDLKPLSVASLGARAAIAAAAQAVADQAKG